MFRLHSNLKEAVTTAVNLINHQQSRNTFILKRKWSPPLHKKGGKPGKLKARHFVYDLIQDTNVIKQPEISIILNQFVDGVGNTGDLLKLPPQRAYKEFLMCGLAVYATPENLQNFKVDETKPNVTENLSSPYVQRTLGCLSRLVLSITMNKLQPWVLEPWHLTTSFRKAGFVVPEHAIQMPPGQIKGPDLSLQNKEFYVTVTVNNSEKVNVRCRIHHWATGIERLPWVEFHWKMPSESIFPEQAEVLMNMPLPE